MDIFSIKIKVLFIVFLISANRLFGQGLDNKIYDGMRIADTAKANVARQEIEKFVSFFSDGENDSIKNMIKVPFAYNNQYYIYNRDSALESIQELFIPLVMNKKLKLNYKRYSSFAGNDDEEIYYYSLTNNKSKQAIVVGVAVGKKSNVFSACATSYLEQRRSATGELIVPTKNECDKALSLVDRTAKKIDSLSFEDVYNFLKQIGSCKNNVEFLEYSSGTLMKIAEKYPDVLVKILLEEKIKLDRAAILEELANPVVDVNLKKFKSIYNQKIEKIKQVQEGLETMLKKLEETSH